MHSGSRATVALIHRTVNDIETILPFVQSQFEVRSLARIEEIDGAPFDVEDAVRRSTGNRRVNATVATRVSRAATVCIRAQIIPVRVNAVVVVGPWQTNVGECRICCRELGISVRRDIQAVESLVVQHKTERKWDVGYYIVAVITGICRAWHDAAAYLNYVKPGTR